jgi:hypothetical protein
MAKLPDYYKVSVDGLTVKLDPTYEEMAEVVRCKDCKHYREGFCFCKNWWKDDGFTEVGETDFCSYGERKDNG